MTAPIVDEFACTAHPEGTVQECGPCATVRRRQKAWMQRYDTPMRGAAYVSPRGRDGRAEENHYEQALRAHKLRTRNAVPSVEGLGVELEAVLADNDNRTIGGDEKFRSAPVLKKDCEPCAVPVVPGVGQVVLDLVRPVVVVVRRRQVKNGSVVVQLDSHGPKRIARRVLAVAAVAALALWAVAS